VGREETPLGRIDLSVTFETPSSFRTETLTFEVVGFWGTYHAIIERPCYTKVYGRPQLHLPRAQNVGIGRRYHHGNHAAACLRVRSRMMLPGRGSHCWPGTLEILQAIEKQAFDMKKASTTFKPANDTKEVPLDPKCSNGRMVCIGANLPPK
jgi:hypothetical protein